MPAQLYKRFKKVDETLEAVELAYMKLEPEERQKIQVMAAKLANTINEISDGKARFGEASALELLGKVGIFLVKKERSLSER
jgi:hypothetical protein